MPLEAGRICRMRTTRERAIRSKVAKPTPSERCARQSPARCQVGRSTGSSPAFFEGGSVHFVHVSSVIDELWDARCENDTGEEREGR